MRVENSFIPVHGVGEVTEKKLWRAGITTWDEFDGSVVGETRADRIYDFIEKSQSHLRSANTTFFGDVFPSGSTWRLYENFRDQACFIDIETTGMSQYRDNTTVVTLYQGGETTTLVRGADLTPERLQSELRQAKLVVSYNGKRFDIPFLQREFDIDISIPHIDLMYPCRSIDLDGGLKQVERELGIERAHPGISGRDAVRLWYQYDRGGDEAALDRLIEYNREDTKNLKTIMDEVSDRLHRRVFQSTIDNLD